MFLVVFGASPDMKYHTNEMILIEIWIEWMFCSTSTSRGSNLAEQ